MLKPSQYALGDILAIDRAYIDYAKFEDHLCEHQEDKGQGQTHLTAYQRHGTGTGGNCGNLPQEMENRAPIQTTEAELPPEILLWWKCHAVKIQIWVTLTAIISFLCLFNPNRSFFVNKLRILCFTVSKSITIINPNNTSSIWWHTPIATGA